jgi:hypothetical protein
VGKAMKKSWSDKRKRSDFNDKWGGMEE